MMLGARTAAWSGKALPYLRRVAYLESTGTQFIEFPFNKFARIECRFSMTELDLNYDRIFSISDMDSNRIQFRYVDGFFGWSDKWERGIYFTQDYYIHSVIVNRGKLYLDGSLYRDFGPNFIDRGTTSGCCLFGLWDNYNKSIYHSKCRIYETYIELYDGTILDLIPVLDFSGRPCMYNKSPGAATLDDPSRFFYNKDTGEFTWGD